MFAFNALAGAAKITRVETFESLLKKQCTCLHHVYCVLCTVYVYVQVCTRTNERRGTNLRSPAGHGKLVPVIASQPAKDILGTSEHTVRPDDVLSSLVLFLCWGLISTSFQLYPMLNNNLFHKNTSLSPNI